jgi:tRNA-2-methylthio-N6-dimethylallyladenosine synthase
MANSDENSVEEQRKRVFVKTYGCQMNQYDTDKLHKILSDDYQPVNRPEDADLVLINTCSVRDKPEHKLYSLLGELKIIRESNPHIMVGVGGCVAQQEGQAIVDRGANVDFVFGTHNLSLVPSLIKRSQETGKPQVAVDYRDEWEELPAGFADVGRVSRFVSISRGCNKACTYCIVPTTRGPEVSRPYEEILREIKIAVVGGSKEIVLLGQTVNSYGLDLNPRVKFSELLARVSELEGVERIRFTSPHPQEIREDFIELVVKNPKVCRHVHMPLQSGSDRILKAMNRNYRREKYLRIINSIRDAVPDMAFTTDIIVGFPGETEEDYQQTLDIMDKVRFDSSYSFVYSPRPGTPASTMSEQIPEDVKMRRLQYLQDLQNQHTTQCLNSWIGKSTEVLLEGPTTSNSRLMAGRNSQNLLVNILNEIPAKAGQTVLVDITESSRFTLRGRVALAAAA